MIALVCLLILLLFFTLTSSFSSLSFRCAPPSPRPPPPRAPTSIPSHLSPPSIFLIIYYFSPFPACVFLILFLFSFYLPTITQKASSPLRKKRVRPVLYFYNITQHNAT